MDCFCPELQVHRHTYSAEKESLLPGKRLFCGPACPARLCLSVPVRGCRGAQAAQLLALLSEVLLCTREVCWGSPEPAVRPLLIIFTSRWHFAVYFPMQISLHLLNQQLANCRQCAKSRSLFFLLEHTQLHPFMVCLWLLSLKWPSHVVSAKTIIVHKA